MNALECPAFADLVQRDPRRAGEVLRDTVWAEPAVALLNGPGWNDGGCLVLSSALALVLRALPHQVVAIVKSRDRSRVAQHTVIAVEVEGQTWYLDADGASIAADLRHRWVVDERVPDPELTPLDASTISPDWLDSRDLGFAVAGYLTVALASATGGMTREEAKSWIYESDEWDIRAAGTAVAQAYDRLVDAVVAARIEE